MLASTNESTFRGTDVHNLYYSNNREQKKLEGKIKEMSLTTRYQMNKINREIVELRKQLVDNQRILGTHSDIKRREGVYFTSDSRFGLRNEFSKPGMVKLGSYMEKEFQGELRRRHSIAEARNTSKFRNLNPARSISTAKPLASSSENIDKRKISSSCSFRRRTQSISSLPSRDKKFCNRGEDSARVMAFSQERTGSRLEKEHQSERPDTRRPNSPRRYSSPSPSTSSVREELDTKRRSETPNLDSRTNAQKNLNADSKGLEVQVQNKVNSPMRQRSHTVPNFMFPLNREQSSKTPFRKTRSRGCINKLTAKLPSSIATLQSARIREPVVLKTACKKVDSSTDIHITPAGEKKESQNQINKDNDFKEVVEDKKDDDVENNRNQDDTSSFGVESESKTPTDELCGIPKITLAEKIEKFFAGAIEFEVAGHYAEVLELYLSEKDEN